MRFTHTSSMEHGRLTGENIQSKLATRRTRSRTCHGSNGFPRIKRSRNLLSVKIRANPWRFFLASGQSVSCQFLHREVQIIRLRQNGIFQDWLVGNEGVLRGDAADRSVELV